MLLIGDTEWPYSSTILYSIFSFIVTQVLTDIALVANKRVEYDSSYCNNEGLIQAHIDVLQFPPKLSVNSLVSLLSLNGTCYNDFSEANTDIQLLNDAIDLLIFFAS